MYYIQETDKPSLFNKAFNIIAIKSNHIILPQNQLQQETKNRPSIVSYIKLRKTLRLFKKLKKVLSKTNCKKVVISKQLKKQENLINYLYANNLEIPDGRWLFEVLSYDAIKYIANIKKLKSQETQIAVVVNYVSEYTIANIKKLIQEFKRINIITNNFSKFKNIEKNILEEYGIMITVSNNKKKSLLKSKIILNIDFPTELINQYTINEEAIILNIQNDVKIEKKRFNRNKYKQL